MDELGQGGCVNGEIFADPVSEKPQLGDTATGEPRIGDGIKEHDGSLDGGILSSAEQLGNAEGADSESLSDLIFDIPELTDAQEDMFYSLEKLLIDEGPDGESHDSEDRIFGLLDDSKSGKSQEQQDGRASSTFHDEEMRDSSKELQGEEAKEITSAKIATEGCWVEKSQSAVEKIQGMRQEMGIYSDSAVGCSGSRNIDEDRVSPLMSLGNGGEVEEGEIPDEVQILENQKLEVYDGFTKREHQEHTSATYSVINCIDGRIGSRENNCSEDMFNLPIHDKKDGMGQASSDVRYLEPQIKEKYSCGIKANANCQDVVPDASGSLGENSENLAFRNKGEPSDVKGVEVCAKKKRFPLTEERKAKKKNAKKRKRAQKDREQGVKRLKLQPIVKPKVVKYCNFYMMGRCQQGDLCKFSHDTTPLTKSQPCRHFACGSCLKGEDCPFDHELSKYPCHNYMSRGMCSRGDECKFSHKMSITEGCSISAVRKSDSPLSSEKQLKANITSRVANVPSKSTTLSAPFSINKNLETNLVKRPKEPVRMPNGIRFVSFGGPPDSADKQDKLLLEKHGGIKTCNQENQGKMFTDGHKNALNSAKNTLFMAQSESNMVSGGGVRHPARNASTSKQSNHGSFSCGPVVAPFSRSLQNEVSDATKILDEFLFGAGS